MEAAAEDTSIISVPGCNRADFYNMLNTDGLSVHLLPRYVVPSFRQSS